MKPEPFLGPALRVTTAEALTVTVGPASLRGSESLSRVRGSVPGAGAGTERRAENFKLTVLRPGRRRPGGRRAVRGSSCVILTPNGNVTSRMQYNFGPGGGSLTRLTRIRPRRRGSHWQSSLRLMPGGCMVTVTVTRRRLGQPGPASPNWHRLRVSHGGVELPSRKSPRPAAAAAAAAHRHAEPGLSGASGKCGWAV